MDNQLSDTKFNEAGVNHVAPRGNNAETVSLSGATDAFERIRVWLERARLVPGDRLPPERALSETLGLSRAELRKGLAVMELNGALQRRVGRGTFLQRHPQEPTLAMSAASGRDQGAGPPPVSVAHLSARTSPHSAMMARLALEPQVAGLAALHATPQQLSGLRDLVEGMRGAGNWADYERLDARFHDAVGDASGNVLLAEMQRIVNAVRVSVVWSRLDRPDGGPPPNYPSFDEHDAILIALVQRNRIDAQNAMRAHLKSIRTRLLPEDE